MRVLVCGGRTFNDSTAVRIALDCVADTRGVDCIIEGNAHGADRIAGHWARSKGITNHKFAADWTHHGKAAGPMRNQRMLDEGKPDLVVAFPGGRGTADMVSKAKAAGVEVWKVGR